MMANPDSTNVTDLPRFSVLSVSDQLAITLRSDGKTYGQISAALKEEFGIDKAVETIRPWFAPGGRLEQAYMDYNQTLADASVKRAKQLAQRLSENAIATLGELMKDGQDGTVRLGAAKALANKYIPDRQTIIGRLNEDDVPSELADEGEDALSAIRGDTTTDGPAATDQPPISDGADADDSGSETASEEAGQSQV